MNEEKPWYKSSAQVGLLVILVMQMFRIDLTNFDVVSIGQLFIGIISFVANIWALIGNTMRTKTISKDQILPGITVSGVLEKLQQYRS
jgi:hypothetical protein